MPNTTTPQGLFQRVFALAQNEARDARARRGLPFCGLFSSAEVAQMGTALLSQTDAPAQHAAK